MIDTNNNQELAIFGFCFFAILFGWHAIVILLLPVLIWKLSR